MKGILVLYFCSLFSIAVYGQGYTGRTIRLGSSAGGETYFAGSLPKTSSAVYQKLKIVINGGSWGNNTIGENEYFISTREGIKINQEMHGGSNSRYELKVFDNGNQYDFVIRVNGIYPHFNIRAWIIDNNGFEPISITDYNTNGKTDYTNNVSIDQFYITSDNGNVGIGKTPDSSTKLDVAGNIKAQEIEVTLARMEDLNLKGTLAANNITVKANGNTADFVFSDAYNLKNLSEVESFIKTNKHLEGIPSAETMEAQGVNLAEMNKLLLQKVEELTLYTIELEKRDKEKEEKLKELDNLKSELEELKLIIQKIR